jgi:AraC-like DNA-binding protein
MLLKEIVSSLRLNILNIGYREHTVDWRYKGVISPFSRMYLITEGEAAVRHHNTEYRLTPGTIHLIPCFTLCDYHCNNSFRLHYIHFTSRLEEGLDICNIGKYNYQIPASPRHFELFERLTALLPGMTISVCRPHSREDKRAFLKKLKISHNALPADVFLEADGIFRQILSGFMRTVTDIEEAPRILFTDVLEYIENNLDKAIPVEKLAAITRHHPNYFSNRFTETFGVRPGEYILRRRIEHAQGVILSGTHTLKEIAAMTGFSDAAHFSRTFKRYTGVPPSQYFDTIGI